MKNKVLTRILSVFGAIVLAVGVGFGACTFKSKNPNFKAKNYIASANDVTGDYAFSGSNLVFVYSSTQGTNPLITSTVLTNYAGYATFAFTQNAVNYKATTSLNSSGFPFIYNGPINNPTRVSDHWSPSNTLSFYEHVVTSSNPGTYSSLFIRVGTDFNADVRGAYVSQYQVGPGYFLSQNGPSNRSLLVNYIRYFGADSNGDYDTTNFIEFATVSNYNLYNTDTVYKGRYYFYELVSRESEQFRLGRDEGLTIGRIEGDTAGYDRGKRDGRAQGRIEGYNEGLAAGSDISFLGMFGAMFDSPVQAITGMFNFDFLGVNILSLVTSLFTLSVLFFIVRLILFK